MSDKKLTIIDRCKNLKAVFDALSILKKLGIILGFLSSLGGLGYFATDMIDPEPVIEDLPKIIEVRKKYFSKPFPCATGVEVSKLLDENWLVEIEAIVSY